MRRRGLIEKRSPGVARRLVEQQQQLPRGEPQQQQPDQHEQQQRVSGFQ